MLRITEPAMITAMSMLRSAPAGARRIASSTPLRNR